MIRIAFPEERVKVSPEPGTGKKTLNVKRQPEAFHAHKRPELQNNVY